MFKVQPLKHVCKLRGLGGGVGVPNAFGPQFLPERGAQNGEKPLRMDGGGVRRVCFPAWPGRLWAFLAGASQAALEEEPDGGGKQPALGEGAEQPQAPQEGPPASQPESLDRPHPPTRPGLSQKARLVPDGRGEGVRCWWTPLQPPWPKGPLGQIPGHLQRASVSTSVK